jgi:hypothetical protein
MKQGSNNTILIGLGVAAAAALYFFKQQTAQIGRNLQFGVKKISFDKSTTEKNLYLRIFLTLTAVLTNTSKLGGRIDSGEISLFFKDKQLTSARLTKAIIVDAEKSIEIPISLSFPTLSVFTTITSAVQYFLQNKKISLNLRGTLNTSAGVVNIDENLSL